MGTVGKMAQMDQIDLSGLTPGMNFAQSVFSLVLKIAGESMSQGDIEWQLLKALTMVSL